jgi:hypothetical protein
MKKHPSHNTNVLQKVPWTDKINTPWSDMNDLEKDGVQDMYNLHRNSILAPNQISDIVSVYNLPCQNTVNSVDILKFVTDIYNQLKRSFKISFSAGLILQHIVTGEYRYWRPYRNQEFFSDPFTISSRNDLTDLKEQLDIFDFVEYTLKQRPDTKYRCVLITQIQMFVFETSYTLGYEPLTLPPFLTNNKHIICFDKHKCGKHKKKKYKDFLCTFRCIAYHKNPEIYNTSPLQFELLTLKYLKMWRTFLKKKQGKNIDISKYEGVCSDDFILLEECFSLSVNIFEKEDKDSVIPIFKSTNTYDDKIYLNIYNKHLSYILNFKHYAKKFRCDSCNKFFTTINKHTQHYKTCVTTSKISFAGGLFKSNNDVWEDLELFGLHITDEEKKYPYFIVFDFECLLEKVELHLGGCTQTESMHKPVSVSTGGNCCDKHKKPLCIVEDDFDTLIDKWLVELQIIGEHIREKLEKKWGGILTQIEKLKELLTSVNDCERKDEMCNDTEGVESDSYEEVSEQMNKALQKENVYHTFMEKIQNVNNYKSYKELTINYNEWTSDEEDDSNNDIEDDNTSESEIKYDIINERHLENIDDQTRKRMYYQVSRLYNKMHEHIYQIPVIGFRSSKYDLLVVRSKLIEKLGLHINKDKKNKKGSSSYVIKRGESYPCIATKEYKFLDITEYVGSHISYSQFLKSMKVKTGRKLFFPYEALQSFSDLNQGLPHINSELWYSTVKQKSVLQDGEDTIENNYKLIKNIWDEGQMTSLKDLLIEYNNCDVGPFISALEAFQNIFHEHGLSVFKSGVISSPGLSRKLLFSTADKQNIPITLFDSKSADLYYSFKKQCYGGASIIFHRYHKVGKTYVRGDKTKICQSLCGLDAVGLYLYCISCEMPVGFPVRRHEGNNFKPETRDRALSTIQWLTWQNKHQNKNILHRYNCGGKERSLANFKFDGWDPVEEVGYEMYGCFWHGHRHINKHCFLSKKMDPILAKDRYEKTMNREKYIKTYCKIKTIWECCFHTKSKGDKQLQQVIDESRPQFYNKHKQNVSPAQILNAVKKQQIYGFIECDLNINEQEIAKKSGDNLTKYNYLKELCPIYGTVDISANHIEGVMKDFIKENNISTKPRRQLVGALEGKKIMIHTELLKYYMELGIYVSHIYQVVEYKSCRVFKPFSDLIMKYRREALQDEDKAPLAQMFKVIGNSGNYTSYQYTEIIFILVIL